jgi:hypothetical protein
MSKIFVEFYIANKNRCQGLHPPGLPSLLIKPAAATEPLSPPPQNRCRLKTSRRRRRTPAVAA